MRLLQELSLLLVEIFIWSSGQDCSPNFPRDILGGGNTTIPETIPEGTVVLAPFLTFTCDGYITHVSVGYEVTNMTSNQTVYLQLRRNVEGTKYSLIHEVMLPVVPDGTRTSILRDYKLPNMLAVRENDVVGFRTPENSSVRVLIDDSQEANRSLYVNENYESDNFSTSMINGTPQISVADGEHLHMSVVVAVVYNAH